MTAMLPDANGRFSPLIQKKRKRLVLYCSHSDRIVRKHFHTRRLLSSKLIKPQSLSDQKVITVSIARARQIKTGIKFLCWVASELNIPCEVGIVSSSFLCGAPRARETPRAPGNPDSSKFWILFGSVYHTLSCNLIISDRNRFRDPH